MITCKVCVRHATIPVTVNAMPTIPVIPIPTMPTIPVIVNAMPTIPVTPMPIPMIPTIPVLVSV